MLTKILLDAPDDVLRAIARLGRTEDVVFSPGNGRVALAGFGADCIALIDVELRFAAAPEVVVTGFTEMRSDAFADPHGLAFLDDQLLAVANRAGGVGIHVVPPPVTGVARTIVEPAMVMSGGSDPVHSPGSVAVIRHCPDLCEVLVCNNYAHHVSRHMVDTRERRVLTGEVVLAHGLVIPDGIAVSNDGRWLAVSNHETCSVNVFDQVAALDPSTPAVGELLGVAYPHGLRFTPDDTRLLVAAAGAPDVMVFERGDGDWAGRRTAVAAVRVLDDETFLRGHHNPQEGGPKGLDIDRTGRVVVLTSEHMPLEFWALAGAATFTPAVTDDAVQAERLRSALLRALDRPRALERRAAELERSAVERAARIGQLQHIVGLTRSTVFEQVALLEQAQLDLADRDATIARLGAELAAVRAEAPGMEPRSL